MDALPPILQRVKDLGFAVFDGGHAYNLNLISIRTKSIQPNAFNDLMTCTYRETPGGSWITKYWACTTDPGLFWLRNPMNVNGTAIIAPGQYRGAYRLDLHAGKYLAICNREKPIRVYRDNNKDEVLDMDPETIQEGVFNCNIHKAGLNSTRVDRWSAGCTVLREGGFIEMMNLAKAQIRFHPTWDRFTYTVLEDE